MPRKKLERRPEKARQLATDQEVADAMAAALASLGGVSKKRARKAKRVAAEIIATGVIPERKSKPFAPPTWEERMAEINARRAALADRTGDTATEAEPVPDEPADKPKARRRPRAGFAGYVDSRLYDNDEDDWS